MSDNKKFINRIVTGLYGQGATGRFFYSPVIKPAHFDSIREMLDKVEIGGRFRVRYLGEAELEDKRAKAISQGKDPNTIAPAFIEYIGKDEVEANRAEWEKKKAEQGL
jgi:hypothetical protein